LHDHGNNPATSFVFWVVIGGLIGLVRDRFATSA